MPDGTAYDPYPGQTSTTGGPGSSGNSNNTGYNWSGYAEWLAKTKNSTKTCNLIVNYYANGYNGSAAENPPPSSVRSYTGQSVDVRLVVEVASGDTMSNPGYIFVGWATSNNTPTITYNPGDTISNSWAAGYRGNSVTNLYAVWTNQNVITYNPDDNSIEKSAIYQVKQSGQSATLKGATFTRTGYTQTGWATTAGGPKVYNLGGTYSSNNPLSLYPVWQANTYTITYVANEGTGTMADQTVTYDSTFTPRACSFIREGYSFSSWNESQDGKGIRWKVQEYTVDRAENITLYAIWKGNEYTVYYDDNYSRYSDEITGDVVTFESEYAQPLKKAEVSLSPIQDLHGYSSPWPAGGGKNKWEFASEYSGNGNLATNLAFTNQIAAGTYVLSCKGTFASGGAVQFRFVYTDSTKKDVILGYKKSGNTYYNSVVFDSNVRSVSFIYSNNAGNSMTDIQFEPGSTFSDYAPYSNICPITGRTGVDAFVAPNASMWSKYKLYVDTGAASELMPVGGQITDTWNNTSGTSISFPWDIVHYTSNGDAFLKWHYAAPEALQFDAPEAIYYFDGTEPAGTYHIPIGSAYGTGWVVGHSIQFTLTAAPDKGDQLVINCGMNNANDPAAGRSWKVYDAGGTTVKQSGTTSEGTDGISLGTIGNVNAHRTNGRLCAISRVVYGYARWSQSAMRQYFNSAEVSWWTMKNPWDRPPAQASTIRGFLCGFSQDFLDHLEETEVVTALNTQEDFAETTETTLDKIFLPSLEQMYINPQLAGVEGESWDYYKALAVEAGLPGKFQQYQTYPILISYNASSTSSAVSVFLRSCSRGGASAGWSVNTSGNVYANTAYNANRGCPACKFKKFTPNGTRYNVDWTSAAGTVYGGTLDVVTGVLTVDRAIVDLGDFTWELWPGYSSVFRTAIPSGCKLVTNNTVPDWLASIYKVVKGTDIATNNATIGMLHQTYLTANNDSYTDAATFKTAMSGVQLCYELATPLTYQLTPTQVAVLTGTNNVWSDGGPITIVYALDEVPQNMPPSTAIFGDIFYTRRNQLSRFGLTFKGWNTVPDGSGEAWLPSGVSMGTYKRTEDAVWNVSHNVTLYAQWDPNVYPFGTVFFNGRNAQDLGIIVEELPSYYYAERAFNHKQVNGKNGDVILDTGRYENVKKVYKVACYDPSRNFYESAVALSTFLHSAGSDYIRLEDSYEPSSYRMAIYEETNEIENLLGKAGRCEITFNCMPQRFLLSGDEEITIPSSGYSIYNPTAFDAKPMIRIQGTGTVTINGRSVQVTENDNDMLVDCENQNAKDLSGADMNYFIYCDEFPILKPGFNTISYTETIDAVKITPRWWIL